MPLQVVFNLHTSPVREIFEREGNQDPGRLKFMTQFLPRGRGGVVTNLVESNINKTIREQSKLLCD